MGAGRPCSVCNHPERDAIDRALIGGALPIEISKQFDIGKQAVMRHRDAHIPTPAMQEGAQALVAADASHGAALVKEVAGLRDKALTILQRAEAANDLRTALMGVREASRCIELMAKLSGELDPTPTVNLILAPQFILVQTAILAALSPFPEARQAVVKALGAVA